jgi:hypothetical protein
MQPHATVLENPGDLEQLQHTQVPLLKEMFEHGTFLQKEVKTERDNGRWRRLEF